MLVNNEEKKEELKHIFRLKTIETKLETTFGLVAFAYEVKGESFWHTEIEGELTLIATNNGESPRFVKEEERKQNNDLYNTLENTNTRDTLINMTIKDKSLNDVSNISDKDVYLVYSSLSNNALFFWLHQDMNKVVEISNFLGEHHLDMLEYAFTDIIDGKYPNSISISQLNVALYKEKQVVNKEINELVTKEDYNSISLLSQRMAELVKITNRFKKTFVDEVETK
ncbi:hypothetical protein P9X10_00835 [Bacillus cereus]|nr:hypothetical protein [Bacillus cereus]